MLKFREKENKSAAMKHQEDTERTILGWNRDTHTDRAHQVSDHHTPRLEFTQEGIMREKWDNNYNPAGCISSQIHVSYIMVTCKKISAKSFL